MCLGICHVDVTCSLLGIYYKKMHEIGVFSHFSLYIYHKYLLWVKVCIREIVGCLHYISGSCSVHGSMATFTFKNQFSSGHQSYVQWNKSLLYILNIKIYIYCLHNILCPVMVHLVDKYFIFIARWENWRLFTAWDIVLTTLSFRTNDALSRVTSSIFTENTSTHLQTSTRKLENISTNATLNVWNN